MFSGAQYLIQYGRPGFVGRFTSELPLVRGDRVVVRGPRGIEHGEVLVVPNRSDGPNDGEVLRALTVADLAETQKLDACGQELLVLAVALGTSLGLPLAFVDVEITFDGTAILHALPWAECDATALLDEVGKRFNLAVRLLDLSRTPAAKDPTGCGKPGCGSETGGCSTCGTDSGGGCSSGSCSRGSVKSAEELTAYFADLRKQMEAAGLARTPLNYG